MKDKQIGVPEVIEKWGVPPEKMIDLQALTGDSVDNVPGVPGIGPKTAAQLLEQFGDLDTLLARAGEIKQDKRRETIIDNADKARISRELVRLKDDVPVADGARRFRAAAAERAEADRLPEGDGVHHADPARRRGDRRRRRPRSSRPRSRCERGADAHGPDLGSGADAARAGRRARRLAHGSGAAAAPIYAQPARAGIDAAALAKQRADAAASSQDRPQRLCAASATCRRSQAWIARGARGRRRRLRHRDHLARPDAGRARRLLAGAPRPGRAAYVPLGPHVAARATCSAAGCAPDQIPLREALAVLAAAAGGPLGAEDRPEHQIRLAADAPATASTSRPSTTRC